MKVQKIFLSVIILFKCVFIYSQSITTVTSDKVGKLSNQIKKKNILEITHLKINGTMNSDDFAYIGTMTNLEYLDIEDVKLSKEKEKNNTGFVQKSRGIGLVLPILKKLKELKLPTFCSYFDMQTQTSYYSNEQVTSIPLLEVLHLSNCCRIYNKKELNFKKVVIDHIVDIDNQKKEEKDYYSRTYRDYGKNDEPLWRYKQISPNIVTDSLIIANGELLYGNCIPLESISPDFIIIRRKEYSDYVILNTWNDKYDLKKIDNIDWICPYAFSKSNITSIKIPEKIKYIMDHCFHGCTKLEQIEWNKICEYIGFGAFIDCPIRDIEIPESVKEIGYTAFMKCPIQTFKLYSTVPPELEQSLSTDEWSSYYTINIPKNSYEAYYALESWGKMNLVEEGTKRSYSVTVETPGNILSSLPLDRLGTIDSLTISGFLYETDLKIIKERCKLLRYLDLSHTYITYSPELIKKEKTEAEALGAIFELIGQGLDNNYKDGNMSTNDYQMNRALAYVLQSATEVKEPEKNCFIPQNALSGMPALEIVKLPLRASYIGAGAFANCRNLKYIEFPPYIETIKNAAFYACTSLQEINFPQSLKTIDAAFVQCNSLKQIKFPASMKKMIGFHECINLEEISFPEGLTDICIRGCYKLNKIFVPSTAVKMNLSNRSINSRLPDGESIQEKSVPADIYFKSSTPPFPLDSGFRIVSKNDRIHIPKGSITAYYNVLGDMVEYIEE